MDYDSNDIQGHSHKLSGEESSKFSPVLHPYVLPKFEFDDNLQSHLRFDTLVGDEVFFGISSQEDNKWIEDFSQGSSGIEFNSGASESCSISRRNNVWFEAASSESVEMLLKSVGQESVLEEAIVEKSDTGNELGMLTKEMETFLKQDDKVEDNTLPRAALPPYNVTEGQQDNTLADHSDAACSGEAESNVVGIVVANEEKLEVDGKCVDAIRTEAEYPINKSPTENMKELSSVSAVHINASSGSHYGIMNSGEMDNQVTDVSAESVDALPVDNSKGILEFNAQSKEFNMVNEILSGPLDNTCTDKVEYPHNGDPMVESLIEQNVEVNISTTEAPQGSPLKVDNQFHLVEGIKNDMESTVSSQHFEAVDCSERPEQCNQFQESLREDPPLGFQSNSSPNEMVVEVGDTEALPSTCPELKIGSVEEKKGLGDDIASLDGQNIRICSIEVKTSSCLDPEMDSAVQKNNYHNSNHENGTDILPEAPVFVDQESGKQSAESAENLVDVSSLTTACSSAEREQPSNDIRIPEVCKSPCTHDELVKPKTNNIAGEGDVRIGDQVVSFNERWNAKEGTSSVQTSPEVGVIAVVPDKKYATETEGNEDTGLLCQKGSLEGSTGLNPVTINVKASNSDQAVAEDGKDYPEKLELCPVSSISIVKPVDDTAAADTENYNELTMERNAEIAVIEVSGDMLGSVVETCLDQKLKDPESVVACETQSAEQIGPSTEGNYQATVALDRPSLYGSDSMNKDEVGPVHLKDNNFEGQQLKIKETANDSFQHIESIGADGTNKSVNVHPEIETTGGLSSFTFDISPSSGPSEGKTSEGVVLSPSIQVDEVQTPMQVIEKSPLTSTSTQTDLKTLNAISHATPKAPAEGKAHVGVKGTPERKSRRASGKATGRSAKKGNNVKAATPGRQSDKEDASLVFMNTPTTGHLVQYKELKPCGDVAKSGSKPLGFVPISTANLPDLNTSVPKAAFFQQPFTDLQQVQLRAQIFVYGSLIQESAPDEACMISAFGPFEGGGDVWRAAWHACVQRVQARKSHNSNMGTPTQSRSDGKALGQSAKHSALHNQVLSTPGTRASTKGIPTPAVTPIIPLSSPLWNASTPCDSLQSIGMPRGGPVSPFHSYQVPGTRNFVGNSPSWPSQSPFPSTWMPSPQTSVSDGNARFSVFPSTEPVKLTPSSKITSVMDVPHDSGGSSILTGTSSQPDMSKMADIPQSAVPKPRKRKNVPSSEGLGQMPLLTFNQETSVWPPGFNSQFSPVPDKVGQKLLLPQSRTESVPTAAVSTPFSTSVAVTVPDRFNQSQTKTIPTGAASTFLSSSLAVTTPSRFNQSRTESVPIAAVSTIFSTSVAVSAPEPSKYGSSSCKFPTALSPISLDDQPNIVDCNVGKSLIQERTSSTVEQAKLHAESAAAHAANAVSHYHDIWSQLSKQKSLGAISDVEATLASSAVAITAATSVARAAAAAAMIASNVAVQAKLMADEVSSSSVIVDSTHNNSSSKASSSAIFNSRDGSVYPSSIIAVAREAAKKRVEAASAASKHAENLDAIVKAAELAAEAVSQAGKILSGGPLHLRELEELGPVGSDCGVNKHSGDCDQPKAFSIELYNFSAEEFKGGSSGAEAKKSGKHPNLEKKYFKAQRVGRTSEFAPEAEGGSRSASTIADDVCTNATGSPYESGMKEGCLVEVFKGGGNYKAAWYSANIISLSDGKAFLCYTDLQAEDGTGQLKEWVPLQGDCNSMPTVRIAHPTTVVRFDGIRKKRKAAVMDHSWSVGDRVDAWMQDCWREGVVKEKNKNDESTLTIDFPAIGDTSIVRAWHLRPTLTWQDGKWIEYSNPRQHSPSQGNIPQEKRARLSSQTEAKGKEQISQGVDLVESRKHDESRLLPVSENEKKFNIGKNTMHENKQDSRRTVRTGLLKEGSKVVFGVPEPGKKRKYMDVSKHYDSDRSKNTKTGYSAKNSNYAAPQVSGSRGWKNTTRIDSKEKQAAEVKPNVPKLGKPPSASSRTLSRKDNISTSIKSTSHDATETDVISGDAISNEEKDTGQDNLMEFGSVSDSQDTSEGQTLVSSLGVSRVASKKASSLNVRSERQNKGKSVPSGGRLDKRAELQEKLVSEVAEPRRSVRKIQPTSRLLEGLQTSLSVSKPHFGNDKGHRSQSRSKF